MGKDAAPFDEFADDYDAALDAGLSATGEDKMYFARGRIAVLQRQLADLNISPQTVIDFGCGTGTSSSLLADLPGVERVIGLDISPQSLETARRQNDAANMQFELVEQYKPDGTADLVFTNGVFHHIPPEERAEAVDFISCCLAPGGLLALWENNPWNPGTRYVMSKIPFDKDAVMLSPGESRTRARAHGFDVLQTRFSFVFPRSLSLLRFAEPYIARLPIGAQYEVLARKAA